jgi:hypothetical protein
MEFNCPVCNKAGLPDFTATHTFCPQCNSDLKPFLLLHAISASKPQQPVRIVLIAFVAIACVLAYLLMYSINEKQKLIATHTAATQQFRDTLQSIRTGVITNPNIVSIRYKVKKGDYPAKIAVFFYNDWAMYKKIEADNNLHQPYILKVGQILTIKINQ